MGLKYLVNYIRTEKCYFYFVLLQLFLIVALIYFVIKDFGNKEKDLVLFILEVIVTAIVLIEVIVRMIIQQEAYFKNCWNIVDLIGIIIIVALFFIVEWVESTYPQNSKEANTILPGLLLIRYIAQFIRVLLTLKQNRDMQQAANEEFVMEGDYRVKQPVSDTNLSLVIDEKDQKNYESLE